MKTVLSGVRIFLLVLGAVFTVNAVVYAIFASVDIGFAATLIMGLIFIASGIFWRTFLKMPKWIRITYYILIGIMLAIMVFIAVFGSYQSAQNDEDVVIVLGQRVSGEKISSTLEARLERVIEYRKGNSDAVIILSGGSFESKLMKSYLLERGVNANNIITEERSENTYENFVCCKEILDGFENNPKVAILTSNYHVFRSSLIADSVGISAKTVSAECPVYLIIPSIIRECVGIARWIVLGY